MSQTEVPAHNVYGWGDGEILGVVGLLILIGSLNMGVLATLGVWAFMAYAIWFLRVNA